MKNWVVIPAFNGVDLLSQCIQSVEAQDGDWHVVLVDNCSTDDTGRQWAKSDRVHYINNKTNLGFGRACNIGTKFAIDQGAETVTFLNQDAVLAPGCLKALRSTLLNNPNCAIVSPINYCDGNQVNGQFGAWLAHGNQQIFADAIMGSLNNDYEVDFLPAACWMMTVKVLQHIGGFDPIFFMYQEDKELASRAVLFGFHSRVSSFARVDHTSNLRAPRKTLIQRIRWAGAAPFANLIGGTRRYSRPFWRNIPATLFTWLSAVSASILGFSLVTLCGQMLGLWRFVILLPMNRAHFYAIKSKQTGLFLDREHHG